MLRTAAEEKSPKKKFTKKEWFDAVRKTEVSKSEINNLIMNFLVVEGYQDTADIFTRESGMESNQKPLLNSIQTTPMTTSMAANSSL